MNVSKRGTLVLVIAILFMGEALLVGQTRGASGKSGKVAPRQKELEKQMELKRMIDEYQNAYKQKGVTDNAAGWVHNPTSLAYRTWEEYVGNKKNAGNKAGDPSFGICVEHQEFTMETLKKTKPQHWEIKQTNQSGYPGETGRPASFHEWVEVVDRETGKTYTFDAWYSGRATVYEGSVLNGTAKNKPTTTDMLHHSLFGSRAPLQENYQGTSRQLGIDERIQILKKISGGEANETEKVKAATNHVNDQLEGGENRKESKSRIQLWDTVYEKWDEMGGKKTEPIKSPPTNKKRVLPGLAPKTTIFTVDQKPISAPSNPGPATSGGGKKTTSSAGNNGSSSGSPHLVKTSDEEMVAEFLPLTEEQDKIVQGVEAVPLIELLPVPPDDDPEKGSIEQKNQEIAVANGTIAEVNGTIKGLQATSKMIFAQVTKMSDEFKKALEEANAVVKGNLSEAVVSSENSADYLDTTGNQLIVLKNDILTLAEELKSAGAQLEGLAGAPNAVPAIAETGTTLIAAGEGYEKICPLLQEGGDFFIDKARNAKDQNTAMVDQMSQTLTTGDTTPGTGGAPENPNPGDGNPEPQNRPSQGDGEPPVSTPPAQDTNTGTEETVEGPNLPAVTE